MGKTFFDAGPFIVKAEMYGIFRLIPRDNPKCEHKACGYQPLKAGGWNVGYTKMLKEVKGAEVKCTFERYKACTSQELSDPTNKVGTFFAAIMIYYSYAGGWSGVPEISTAIFLHDLIEDKVKDKWFQHGPKQSIQPHSQIPNNWTVPSAMMNISQVLDGMRKEI